MQIEPIKNNHIDEKIMESVILRGDVSGLTPMQKVQYITSLNESCGLNPIQGGFQLLKLSGREVAYAPKSVTEQLRMIHGISVVEKTSDRVDDIYIVNIKVQNGQGRTDIATGAVNIAMLKGDALANAIMKAETKAKRRATLSIAGLGILDESEIETIPNASKMDIEADVRALQKGNVMDDQARKQIVIELREAKKQFESGIWEQFFPVGKNSPSKLSDEELSKVYTDVMAAISDINADRVDDSDLLGAE
jgi:hypothetical protein